MKSALRTALLGLTLAATLGIAQAQTTTFANFTQDVGAAKVFQFINTGSLSTSGLFTQPTTVQVNFVYLVPTNDPSVPVGTPLTANLTISSSASANAQVGSVTVSQPLQNVEMSFIGVGGTVNGKNLLTLFASTGTLGGELGSDTAGLEETSGGSQIVNFSSDYLSFSSTTQRNYSLALNNLTPPLAVNPNGILANFAANATGQFAANLTVVPEPSSVALFGGGLFGLLIVRRRKYLHC